MEESKQMVMTNYILKELSKGTDEAQLIRTVMMKFHRPSLEEAARLVDSVKRGEGSRIEAAELAEARRMFGDEKLLGGFVDQHLGSNIGGIYVTNQRIIGIKAGIYAVEDTAASTAVDIILLGRGLASVAKAYDKKFRQLEPTLDEAAKIWELYQNSAFVADKKMVSKIELGKPRGHLLITTKTGQISVNVSNRKVYFKLKELMQKFLPEAF